MIGHKIADFILNFFSCNVIFIVVFTSVDVQCHYLFSNF